MIAVGFPTNRGEIPRLSACAVPKIFVQSTFDVHGPRNELEAFYATVPEPKRLIFLEAADHFFDGALPDLERTLREL